MPASLVSLLLRPLRAIARRMPSSAPTFRWTVEGGVSAAVWTAPDPAAGSVPSIRFEIRPDTAARQPFVLTVSPEDYVPLSFPVTDLETAHELARRQLAVARRLPEVRPADSAAPADESSPESGAFRPASDATEHAPDGRNEAA